MMLANPAQQFPVFSPIVGAKHMPVRSSEVKDAGAARGRCQGLHIPSWRANLTPGLRAGRNRKEKPHTKSEYPHLTRHTHVLSSGPTASVRVHRLNFLHTRHRDT